MGNRTVSMADVALKRSLAFASAKPAVAIKTDESQDFLTVVSINVDKALALLSKDDPRLSEHILDGVNLLMNQRKYPEVVDLVTKIHTDKNLSDSFRVTWDLVYDLEKAIISTRNPRDSRSPDSYKAAELVIKIMDANLPLKIKAQVIINTTSDLLKSTNVSGANKLELYEEIVRRAFKEGYITSSQGYLADSINRLNNPTSIDFTGDLPVLLVDKVKQTAADLKRDFAHLLPTQ